MIQRLRVTVLAENCAGRRGLLGEHGLAWWVEADNECLIFDTGQGLALTANAAALGIDLARADQLVLSHGHYDHTGGLGDLLVRRRPLAVYAHPRAFEPKYTRRADGRMHPVGCPLEHAPERLAEIGRLVYTSQPTEIRPGIHVTGTIPRPHALEDTGGAFFLDEAGTRADDLLDDQALYFDTPAGVVVLTGCGHAGVVNTLDYVSALTGGRPLHAVLGGFHLVHASAERIDWTLEALRRRGLQRLGPVHCTGLPATARMLQAFPEQFVHLTAGAVLNLC